MGKSKRRGKWGETVMIELMKRNMTQKELAEAIGLDVNYVRTIINGQQIRENPINLISDYLNISNDYDIG